MSTNGNVNNYGEDVLHTVLVRMHRSNLPRAKGRWFARTANNRVLNIEKVCGSLRTRGGGTGNYTDLITHVRQYFDEAAYLLADGFAIDTGYYTIYPVVKGSFRTEHEVIDRDAHRVEFHFRPRAPLRRLAGFINLKVQNWTVSGFIERFVDTESGAVGSGSQRSRLTPDSLFIITGTRIKVVGADSGVWFVSQADGRRYNVTRALIENTGSKVIGIAPSLPAGEYTLEIVTRYTPGGAVLKNARTVKSRFTLTV